MGGNKHISEGRCAIYGRESPSETHGLQIWRNRLHNEHAGMPTVDNTGTNTTVSLMWNPSPRGAPSYTMASRKRQSDLKRIQDFGLGAGAPPAVAAPPSAAGTGRREAAAAAMASPRDTDPGFLDTESGRLQAAGHARNLGQTFLLAGNLRQAKAYLAKAEKLLQVDKDFHSGPKAQKALDEMQAKRLHPY